MPRHVLLSTLSIFSFSSPHLVNYSSSKLWFLKNIILKYSQSSFSPLISRWRGRLVGFLQLRRQLEFMSYLYCECLPRKKQSVSIFCLFYFVLFCINENRFGYLEYQFTYFRIVAVTEIMWSWIKQILPSGGNIDKLQYQVSRHVWTSEISICNLNLKIWTILRVIILWSLW